MDLVFRTTAGFIYIYIYIYNYVKFPRKMYPQICKFFIEKSMSCSTELVSTHKRHSVHILATCDLKEQSLGLHYFSFHADDLNMHFMIGFVHS